MTVRGVLRRRSFALNSPLPPEELDAALLTPVEMRVLRVRNWEIVGSTPDGNYRILGWRRGATLCFRAQEHLRRYGGAPPIASGSITAAGTGSRLAAHIRPPRGL